MIRVSRSSQLSSKQKPGMKEKNNMEKFPTATGARNRLHLTTHNYDLEQPTDDEPLGGAMAAEAWLQATIDAAALVQIPGAGCGVLRTEYLFLHYCLVGERDHPGPG